MIVKRKVPRQKFWQVLQALQLLLGLRIPSTLADGSEGK